MNIWHKLKIVFLVIWGPKTDFNDTPSLIRRWSIDCDSLVFFDKMTKKISLKR